MGEAGVAAASGPELMALVAAGAPGAFELLMRTHNQRLYRTARSILRDDAEAEDVVQEAYLLAYRKATSFRGEASVSTWLTRIVVNEANARLRRQLRRDGILRLVPGSGGTPWTTPRGPRPTCPRKPHSAWKRAG